ncbi:MAG: class I SAM-dependent methyltransferase [Acidimicrobiia bacterium]
MTEAATLGMGDGGTAQRRGPICDCCGGTAFDDLYEPVRHRYLRCTGCGSGQLADRPDADPVHLYDEGYFTGAAHGGYLDYDADAGLHARNAEARLDRIAPHLPARRPLRLLDVGCASGYVLNAARARGMDTIGVDPAASARRRAAEQGHPVHAELADAVAALDSAGTRLDVACFFQVLEHLAEPAAALAAVATTMDPGAVLAIETWDLHSRVARLFGKRWQQANPPSVIHLFTLCGVNRMVERAGFEVVASSPTSKLVSAGLVAGVAAHRWGPIGRTVRRVADGPLGAVAVPYRLGDLVTVLAVRRDAPVASDR